MTSEKLSFVDSFEIRWQARNLSTNRLRRNE